jgi:hypothetical protein
MIIKGKSRGGPKQLATHLLRSDTNERVEVLELKSPAPNITEAFRDWQLLADGTKGTRGLYHANIDPDAKYVMSRDQWRIAVDRLEKELGLDGQPRAVVLHEKNGRAHAHVVWQRTNIDSMTLVSDSHNYHAHERASLALEEEFGHAVVPGKHAKRDRDRPPPRAEVNHAEAQQAERSGLDPREFKQAITALYEHADNAQAFHAALEERGLLLAKGDRRDFVIVDGAGEVYSLSRQIKGVAAKELRAFMEGVAFDSSPSVEEARAEQRESAASAPETVAPTLEPSDPEPPPAPSGPSDAEKHRAALESWHAEDLRKLTAFHDAERARTAEILDREISEKLAHLDAVHEIGRLRYAHNTERRGFAGLIDAVRSYFSPTWAATQSQARDQNREAFAAALAHERNEQAIRLHSARNAELADLTERQLQQLREREARFNTELARRVSDYEDAQRFLARLEEQRRLEEERQEEKHSAPGPEPPSRAR